MAVWSRFLAVACFGCCFYSTDAARVPRFLQACRSLRKRCRKNRPCCDGLKCRTLPRVINKQGDNKEVQRCVDPDAELPILKHKKFECKPELGRCKKSNKKCCEGLQCLPVDRYVDKRGRKKSELRCLDPGKATPVLGKCLKEGKDCRDGEGPSCCGGLACSGSPGGKCGPFAPRGLSNFNREILAGYNREDELVVDIEAAANALIDQAKNADIYRRQVRPRRPARTSRRPAREAAPDAEQDDGDDVGDEIDDFGTNNQEDDVEEGDVIVSDGTYVYAAYGDLIVIWNPRTLTVVDTVKMPEIEESERRLRRRKAGFSYSRPRATIRHLVLYKERLLVVVDGYQDQMMDAMGAKEPVLSGFLATHLRLYKTTATANLEFVKDSNIHGRFSELRVINGKAHVMAISSVNTNNYLVDPFLRWWFYRTDEEYEAMVQELRPKKVEEFKTKLLAELRMPNGVMPNLIKINAWQEQLPENVTVDQVIGGRFNVMDSLALIHTFDMEEDTMMTSSSGSFMPGSRAQFYGNSKTLVITGQGWNTIPGQAFWRTISTTYLIAFQVDDANVKTIPHSVGHVDGYLLNNHAMDVVDDVLRIGTSINQWWRVRPMLRIDLTAKDKDNAVGDGDDVTVVEPISRTENNVILLRMPGLQGVDADGDGEEKTEKPGVMEEIARLKLGLPNELFTALRFFDDVGYAVTFERTDPLYVIDFSKPTEPNVTAALKISGFSSYLHSMNADNSLILAIGQEADNRTGASLGVALTVFDVSDLSNPIAVQRFVVEQNQYDYSYTDMENDFKAGRYVRQISRLVIPLNIFANDTDDSFHGFRSFYVGTDEIREECSIAHGVNYTDYCYYCAWFPARSMIFDGNLMTVKDHFVKSTDMDTCESAVEDMEVVIDDDDDCCAMWYY